MSATSLAVRVGECAVVPLDEVRGSRRRVVSLSAFAREMNSALLEVEISDLSADGCRLRCDTPLEQATALWLRIPGVTPKRAVIRWSKGDEAGCQFDDPLPEETLDGLSANAQQTARDLRKKLQGSFGQNQTR